MAELEIAEAAPVRRQEWRSIAPPELGSWNPQLTVSVVLPAKDCQNELDRTLAALSGQSYPAELLDVTVVDDDSKVPLILPSCRPARTRICRLPPAEGHGSGRARHAGALASSGDVLLFLDADMVASRQHVEAHARWHHVLADAVVLGRKYFVDFDGISPADVAAAVLYDRLDVLLEGRRRERHRWWEEFVRSSRQLSDWASDTFIAVVGASVSTARTLYEECGGFSSIGLRGIVDTEFGYRIFTAGGVVVPELDSETFHQGTRNFALRGDEIKRERMGLAANHLPVPMFRRANTGRVWAVPSLTVIVDASSATDEEVLLTVDSVLASAFSDLIVVVAPRDTALFQRWLLDYFAHDQRVSFASGPLDSGFPSPFTAVVAAGTTLAPRSVTELIAATEQEEVGVVRATVSGSAGCAVELWATRALHRSRRHQGVEGLEHTARRLFGERWLSGEELGLCSSVLAVTPQGMLIDDSRDHDEDRDLTSAGALGAK